MGFGNNSGAIPPALVGDLNNTITKVTPQTIEQIVLHGQEHIEHAKLSRGKTISLGVVLFFACICWGCLVSLQSPLYPSEAELKGATPSQVNSGLNS